MIENMLLEIKPFLPLKILDINWDMSLLQMHGEAWNFNTLSAWRIYCNGKLICACNDENSMNLINNLRSENIIEIKSQGDFLMLDPVFIFSNGYRMEIFSTDTFEPWVFVFGNSDKNLIFVASPGSPEIL